VRLAVLGLIWICLLALPVQAGQAIKLSLGQYRVVANERSYWYTPVSAHLASGSYKAKLTLPFVKPDAGPSGIGNGVLKLSYQDQWSDLYLDFHLKRKLANANSRVTLPVNDTSLSMEVSGFLWGGVGFVELGYWWRKRTQYNRVNSFHYSVGGVMSLRKLGFDKGWIAGLVVDHKPTSLGNLDRVASGLLQRKINARHKLTASVGKGISRHSPDWISGLLWQVKY